MNISNVELNINGVKYIQVNENNVIKIVILQRGWVMVGKYSRSGDDCSLTDASIIRVWGTTKGLGELAKNGPMEHTELDPANGLVEFHRLTEIATITVDQEKWKCSRK